MIGEFVAHDSSPQFGSLNHRGSGLTRRFRAGPGWTLTYSATIWVGRARRSGWRVSVAAR
ncbi:hypothetical protein DXU07_08640 [Bradyrhizobium elkanii]|nr:hypothetical protein [Bradyrhizobium brasilense]NWL42223.1 hypothetical protein [Bradyrhizobium elkanii]NWL72394.1 hypothetical protein [Bradyrhizobium elkanii]QOZ15431.1 hypothetical protein XI02_10715 [Bradyrhizobium sp. CCBAU 21365]